MMYSINNELNISNKDEVLFYLEDIAERVNSILLYHKGYDNLDLEEIIMYLSSVDEIIQTIKAYLIKEL